MSETFEEWCARTEPPTMPLWLRLPGWVVLAIGFAALRGLALAVFLLVLAALAWTAGDAVLARVRYARRRRTPAG